MTAPSPAGAPERDEETLRLLLEHAANADARTPAALASCPG